MADADQGIHSWTEGWQACNTWEGGSWKVCVEHPLWFTSSNPMLCEVDDDYVGSRSCVTSRNFAAGGTYGSNEDCLITLNGWSTLSPSPPAAPSAPPSPPGPPAPPPPSPPPDYTPSSPPSPPTLNVTLASRVVVSGSPSYTNSKEESWTLLCDGVAIVSDQHLLEHGPDGLLRPYNMSHTAMPGAQCTLLLFDSRGDGWAGAKWMAPGWTDQVFTLENGYAGKETFMVPNPAYVGSLIEVGRRSYTVTEDSICQGTSNAYFVDDGTSCDNPQGGLYRCTRNADDEYCKELCTAAPECSGFSRNEQGCFFRSGPLTLTDPLVTSPADGALLAPERCYEKNTLPVGLDADADIIGWRMSCYPLQKGFESHFRICFASKDK